MSVQMEEFVWNGQLNTSELYSCPDVVDNLLVCHFLKGKRDAFTPEEFLVRCLDYIYVYPMTKYIYIKLVYFFC